MRQDLGTFVLNGSRMSGNVVQGSGYADGNGGAMYIARSAGTIVLDGAAAMDDNKAGYIGGKSEHPPDAIVGRHPRVLDQSRPCP